MKYFPKSTKSRIIILVTMLILSAVIFFAMPRNGGNVIYGVTFSRAFAEHLGLNWKEAFIALLDDAGVRRFRLPTYWTEIEGGEGKFYFDNIDWQINEAEKREAKIILTVGQKQPRWPECHIPGWAQDLSDKKRQDKLLEVIGKTVERYKSKSNVIAWQVENEPFLPYGECPELDEDFLDREIALVRSLDSRPIIVSDSGEFSTWYNAAKRADILGTTLYRIVWDKNLGYFHYPIDSVIYRIKAAVIRLTTKVQKIIIIELQGEPWGPKMIIDTPLKEQYKSMSLEQFKENIRYVKRVEFSEAYLWGAEWWYWLKTVKNDDSIWNEAKNIFNGRK